MIHADLRTEAIKHAMIELRASGPCTTGDIRHALVVQCPGVNDDNAADVTAWVVGFLKTRRVVEPYGDDGAFDIRSR